jgi:hypothetical protein
VVTQAAADSASTEAVIVERRGAILLMTLNRPSALNSVNAALSTGLRSRRAAVRSARRWRSLRRSSRMPHSLYRRRRLLRAGLRREEKTSMDGRMT